MPKDTRPKAVVFDIDGTLADYTHRAEHLVPPNRDMAVYFSKMGDDPPITAVVALLIEAYGNGYKVVLVTGRPEQYYKTTFRWLTSQNIPFDALFLRPRDDWRPGVDVRRDIYKTSIEPHYNVLYAADDNPKMITLWQELGVKSLMVGNGKLPETP